MHYTIETTDTFLEWFEKLKDKTVKNKILARWLVSKMVTLAIISN